MKMTNLLHVKRVALRLIHTRKSLVLIAERGSAKTSDELKTSFRVLLSVSASQCCARHAVSGASIYSLYTT